MTYPRPLALLSLIVTGAIAIYQMLPNRRGGRPAERWVSVGIFLVVLGFAIPGDGPAGTMIGLLGIVMTGYGIWMRRPRAGTGE